MKRLTIVLCLFAFGCHNCPDSLAACATACEKTGKSMQKCSDIEGCICEPKK